MEEYIEVGKIVNTHGVKGELKIIPTTDDPKRFELLEEIFVNTKEGPISYKVDNVRYLKNFVLLKLKGIDDMTQAERLKTCVLKIPRDLALPLGENEYYIGDLYNMKVLTDDGEDLGEIIDILFTGSNDVYIVKNKANPNSKEILIPAIKQCILNVDIKENTMIVHLLEGLRE